MRVTEKFSGLGGLLCVTIYAERKGVRGEIHFWEAVLKPQIERSYEPISRTDEGLGIH